MIIYSVTVTVDLEIEDEWVAWMRAVHIPDVLKTGLFKGCRMLKVHKEDHGDDTSYNFQYLLESLDNYQMYKDNHAPHLQKDVADKFGGKFAAFRTVLDVVEIWN